MMTSTSQKAQRPICWSEETPYQSLCKEITLNLRLKPYSLSRPTTLQAQKHAAAGPAGMLDVDADNRIGLI